MTWSSFRYLVKEGFRSVVANRMMSVASVLVLVACMLLTGASFLFTINVNKVVDYMASQTEMFVEVEDDLDLLVKEKIEYELDSLEYISNYVFVPKEEGFKNFKDAMGDQAHDLFEELLKEGRVPAPDAYKITLGDPSKMREVQIYMENLPGVEFVQAPTDLAETLTNVKNIVNLSGYVIVIVLIIVSLVITANTIKLTVFNRRREINIMKYVGATDIFIRLPFVVEGIIIGLLAAVISILITWAYYTYILKWVANWKTGGWLTSAMGTLVPFVEIVPQLGTYFVIGGIVVGILSSVLFVRKHLKV